MEVADYEEGGNYSYLGASHLADVEREFSVGRQWRNGVGRSSTCGPGGSW